MPAPFRLYNTLSRQVEDFVPHEPGHIRLYLCGMTVYDHAHVGHARAMVCFDSIIRYLRSRDWKVTYVRNFTDVDDKIIRRAAERGVEPLALAEEHIEAFGREMTELGLAPPDHEPRVTASIPEIQAMVATLIERGHAYEQDGNVWFSVSTCADYGQLSGQKVDELRSADVGDKREPADFALWKAVKPGEPAWDSPWGPGRPGWHIECSAMAHRWLGQPVDIHGGGLDLVFPHHENEIAQSECALGERYVRYWVHNGLLTMTRRGEDGKMEKAAKMGKSLGNAVNIRDALRAFPAEALRLYYLQSHYRSPLPWNEEALPEALAMVARIYDAVEVAEAMGGEEDAATVAEQLGPDAQAVLELGRSFVERFRAAMDDDFNTSQALGHAFELVRAINRFSNHKKAARRGGPVVAPALAGLRELQNIGLLLSSPAAFQDEVKDKRLAAMGIDRAEIEGMLTERQEARASKDWARADALRQALDERDIVVMDRPEGVSWKMRLSAPA